MMISISKRFSVQPSQATTWYAFIGRICSTAVKRYFQALRVIADNVSAKLRYIKRLCALNLPCIAVRQAIAVNQIQSTASRQKEMREYNPPFA